MDVVHVEETINYDKIYDDGSMASVPLAAQN